MSLIAWTYDIARGQSPRTPILADWLRRSADVGYNAVGLYLEHRFAYASAPWAAGPGSLMAESVAELQREFLPAGFRLIPMINTLGHMEGFCRAQGGEFLCEGPRNGTLQICPMRPACQAFVRGLVSDVIGAFDDEWLHLGGDEPWQLGQCPACAARVAAVGKAGLYGEHYGALCRYVIERGRRPCLWADAVLEHPEALRYLPAETILFDWQYFQRPLETSRRLRDAGFDVVCCPSLQTYNSGWCFLSASQENIDQHARDARAAGAAGVCLTTWELEQFSAYEAVMPLIFAAGRRLSRGEGWGEAIGAVCGEAYRRAAEILGDEIPSASAFIRPGTWRTLRDRFVMRLNPFELWRGWREEACGPSGDRILVLCDEADALLHEDDALRFAIALHRCAVLFVRGVERAYLHYQKDDAAGALGEIEALRTVLRPLHAPLAAFAVRGGCAADLARLAEMERKLDIVQPRIQAAIAARSAGQHAYKPAFEVLLRDEYIADDQAAWRAGAAD